MLSIQNYRFFMKRTFTKLLLISLLCNRLKTRHLYIILKKFSLFTLQQITCETCTIYRRNCWSLNCTAERDTSKNEFVLSIWATKSGIIHNCCSHNKVSEEIWRKSFVAGDLQTYFFNCDKNNN